MFQARHYRALAHVFTAFALRTTCRTKLAAAADIAHAFARLFASDNARFNADRFIDACGLHNANTDTDRKDTAA